MRNKRVIIIIIIIISIGCVVVA